MSHLSSLPQKECPSVFALHFSLHTNPAISSVLPLSAQALGLQAVGDPVFPPVYMIGLGLLYDFQCLRARDTEYTNA